MIGMKMFSKRKIFDVYSVLFGIRADETKITS